MKGLEVEIAREVKELIRSLKKSEVKDTKRITITFLLETLVVFTTQTYAAST